MHGCLTSHTPLRRVWLSATVSLAQFMKYNYMVHQFPVTSVVRYTAVDHTTWCPSEAAHWLGLGNALLFFWSKCEHFLS